MGIWRSTASGERCEVIDSYLLWCRSKEEIIMLEGDARNMVEYHKHQKQGKYKDSHQIHHLMVGELQCYSIR